MTSLGFLDPGDEDVLKRIIADAVESALRAFLLGSRSARTAKGVDASDASDSEAEELWRAENLERYRPGWKTSLVKVVPYRKFRPSEILKEHGSQLKAWHPTHNNISSAIANVLSWLVADGVLAKMGPGLYAPARDGAPLV